jgi:hypothetical protein
MNHLCPFDKRDERAIGVTKKRRNLFQMIHPGSVLADTSLDDCLRLAMRSFGS